MIAPLIDRLFREALSALGWAMPPEIPLERPSHAAHGDLACPLALSLAKEQGRPPRTVAEEIRQHFPQNESIASITVAGPGFLNIRFSDAFLMQVLQRLDPLTPPVLSAPRKILIDFSSPNIGKPLHFGHFRSSIIGAALVKIFRFLGHQVTGDNFLGDWGTSFGKLIVALEEWGDKEKTEQQPIEHLVALYARFHEEAPQRPELDLRATAIFREMECEENEKLLSEWQWIVQVSLQELQRFYVRLGISFDRIQGEHFYAAFSEETLALLEHKGIAKREDAGALVVFFPEEEGLPPLIVQKSDGATLYQTRDISRILFSEKEGYDELLYVVAQEQELQFRQLFSVAKKLGIRAHLEHVRFGLVLGKDGKKFSTRRGNGVGLTEVLDEAEEKTRENIRAHNGQVSDELVQILSLGALKWNDLSQNRLTNIAFDWDKALDMNGFSGPFVQYAAVRIHSLIRKFGEGHLPSAMSALAPEERALILRLADFFPVLTRSAEEKSPHFLAQFLFDLSGDFHRFYAAHPIADYPFRLYLAQKTGKTLEKGLALLGIETPEKM